MRFKKSVLDGEGMRFKKLMAEQLARLRSYRSSPIEDASDERGDGGSSSDILEGEGMRFKRAHSNRHNINYNPYKYYSKYNHPAHNNNRHKNYLTDRIKQIYVVYDK